LVPKVFTGLLAEDTFGGVAYRFPVREESPLHLYRLLRKHMGMVAKQCRLCRSRFLGCGVADVLKANFMMKRPIDLDLQPVILLAGLIQF
jgi:hypothetical protein